MWKIEEEEKVPILLLGSCVSRPEECRAEGRRARRGISLESYVLRRSRGRIEGGLASLVREGAKGAEGLRADVSAGDAAGR